MQIPVVVELLVGDGHLARTGELLPLRAAGASRDKALCNLEQVVQQRLLSGISQASINVENNSDENPWIKFAGMFKDEPMFDEVRQIMADNRKRDDADPNYL